MYWLYSNWCDTIPSILLATDNTFKTSEILLLWPSQFCKMFEKGSVRFGPGNAKNITWTSVMNTISFRWLCQNVEALVVNSPDLPDPSRIHVGRTKRTKIFSVLAGLPTLTKFPQSSFSEHWSFNTCINLEENLITVSAKNLSLIHIWRCRRYAVCRSRWSPYH